jgi:hypothetical protein
MSLPGTWLRALASRVCRRETMERLIDPVIADMQAEQETAGRRGRGRAVLWRGYLSFWLAVGVHCIAAPFQPSSKDAGDSLVRVIAYPLVVFLAMTALLMAPPLFNGFAWRGSAAERIALALTLVPQALPLTIPAGLCLGLIAALRGRRPTTGRLLTVLALAAVATVAVWSMLEWGVPAGNQGFRELVAARLGDGRTVQLDPGLNELGLSRLAQRTDPAAVRHSRLLWALCFASGPLAIFAYGVSARVRRFSTALALGLAACLAYIFATFGLDESMRNGLPGAAAAWVPNVLLLVAGVLLLTKSATGGERHPRLQ